jgi:phosphoglycolate phosphatase-like HAD superfamily hydrolase
MKPDPAPVLYAAGECATRPAEVVLAGEPVTDITAGRAAGVPPVWPSCGNRHGQDIGAAAPDAVLHARGDLHAVPT